MLVKNSSKWTMVKLLSVILIFTMLLLNIYGDLLINMHTNVLFCLYSNYCSTMYQTPFSIKYSHCMPRNVSNARVLLYSVVDGLPFLCMWSEYFITFHNKTGSELEWLCIKAILVHSPLKYSFVGIFFYFKIVACIHNI